MYLFTAASLFISTLLTAETPAANVPPSPNPPGGLKVDNVPMFVAIGWDDNSMAGFTYMSEDGKSIHWIRNYSLNLKNPAGKGNAATYDGKPVRFSFFNNSCYISDMESDYFQQVKVAWNMCWLQGHEVGNHTHSHITNYQGPKYTVEQWQAEIQKCNGWLTKVAPPLTDSTNEGGGNQSHGAGIPKENIYGFRTPYLYYNDNTFSALKAEGFLYDCSIEDGFQNSIDGTNFLWPYTLDKGSPGHDYLKENGMLNEYMKGVTIGTHPGLWEMPASPVIVPPDELCSQYGVDYSIRKKIKSLFSWFDDKSGKVTGLDYNIFEGYRLNKNDALAILKYTLDLRLKGNRAPFLFGAHSQYYNARWLCNGEPSDENRRWTIEEFIKYALQKPDVRMVPFIDVLRWCEKPVGLDGSPSGITASPDTHPSIASIRLNGKALVVAPRNPGTYLVTIYSMSGRTIHSLQRSTATATDQIRIPLSTMTKGQMYTVRVANRESSITQKFLHPCRSGN